MASGAWSEGRRLSCSMWWLLKPGFCELMNMRSRTELRFALLSANLVGPGLMGEERSRLYRSAIIVRLSA